MKLNQVIWPLPVREKLLAYRSEHFTPEETFDFIVQIILELESLLLNPVVGKIYTEEFGEYKGCSRVVVRKFRFYVEQIDHDAVVVAIKYPREK